MNENCDFGGWLLEDLKDYHEDLLKERNRCDMYSDRVEINNLIKQILGEIQSRERNS